MDAAYGFPQRRIIFSRSAVPSTPDRMATEGGLDGPTQGRRAEACRNTGSRREELKYIRLKHGATNSFSLVPMSREEGSWGRGCVFSNNVLNVCGLPTVTRKVIFAHRSRARRPRNRDVDCPVELRATRMQLTPSPHRDMSHRGLLTRSTTPTLSTDCSQAVEPSSRMVKSHTRNAQLHLFLSEKLCPSSLIRRTFLPHKRHQSAVRVGEDRAGKRAS